MYLIDTNVLSEYRRIGAGKGDAQVAAWAMHISSQLQFISVVTLLELERGQRRMAYRDVHQGAMLRVWLDQSVIPSLAGRILGIDQAVVMQCAALHVPDPRPELDAFIAATALVHNLTVVTRNTADFAPLGVKLLNPWEPQ
jgi:toxin FitB